MSDKTLLSENAVKCRLTVKHWSGIKVDKHQKKKLADINKANQDFLDVRKHLVGKKEADYFRKIINKFRNDHYYSATFAWGDKTTDYNSGRQKTEWRLIPITKLDQLMDMVEIAKKQFDKEVDSFCERYPRLIEDARVQLGETFIRRDYPSVNQIREKFYFDFEIEAVTEYESTTDIRLNCSEALKKRIESDAKKRVTDNVNGVMKQVVSGLLGQVDELVEKLVKYDPKNKQKNFFKDASFNNLKKILDNLPSINNDLLGGDADIKSAHQNLVALFAKLGDVEELRQSDAEADSKRKKVAKDLADSVDDLKGSFLDKAMK